MSTLIIVSNHAGQNFQYDGDKCHVSINEYGSLLIKEFHDRKAGNPIESKEVARFCAPYSYNFIES